MPSTRIRRTVYDRETRMLPYATPLHSGPPNWPASAGQRDDDNTLTRMPSDYSPKSGTTDAPGPLGKFIVGSFGIMGLS